MSDILKEVGVEMAAVMCNWRWWHRREHRIGRLGMMGRRENSGVDEGQDREGEMRERRRCLWKRAGSLSRTWG